MRTSMGSSKKKLTKKEIDGLLELVALTKDVEIDCAGCLSRVSEFVEQEIADKPVSEGLKAVKHHLDVCGECREEYEALQRALRELEE